MESVKLQSMFANLESQIRDIVFSVIQDTDSGVMYHKNWFNLHIDLPSLPEFRMLWTGPGWACAWSAVGIRFWRSTEAKLDVALPDNIGSADQLSMVVYAFCLGAWTGPYSQKRRGRWSGSLNRCIMNVFATSHSNITSQHSMHMSLKLISRIALASADTPRGEFRFFFKIEDTAWQILWVKNMWRIMVLKEQYAEVGIVKTLLVAIGESIGKFHQNSGTIILSLHRKCTRQWSLKCRT